MDIKIQTLEKTPGETTTVTFSDAMYDHDQFVDLVVNDEIWFPFELDDLLAALSAFDKKRQLNRDFDKHASQ